MINEYEKLHNNYTLNDVWCDVMKLNDAILIYIELLLMVNILYEISWKPRMWTLSNVWIKFKHLYLIKLS